MRNWMFGALLAAALAAPSAGFVVWTHGAGETVGASVARVLHNHLGGAHAALGGLQARLGDHTMMAYLAAPEEKRFDPNAFEALAPDEFDIPEAPEPYVFADLNERAALAARIEAASEMRDRSTERAEDIRAQVREEVCEELAAAAEARAEAARTIAEAQVHADVARELAAEARASAREAVERARAREAARRAMGGRAVAL